VWGPAVIPEMVQHGDQPGRLHKQLRFIIVIIIIIKKIYIAKVRRGHKCAMSAEMAVWLRLYSYLHN